MREGGNGEEVVDFQDLGVENVEGLVFVGVELQNGEVVQGISDVFVDEGFEIVQVDLVFFEEFGNVLDVFLLHFILGRIKIKRLI